MSIQTLEIDKELDEVIKLITSGKKDPEALRVARERAERIRLQSLERYGVRDLAVELIHEARDSR